MKFLCELLLVVLIALTIVISQEDEEYESVSVELQLADYDLSDAYDEISEATKEVLLGIHNYEDKVILEKDRGKLLRIQSEKNFQIEGDVPYDLVRNWTLLTKTGDMLLPEADFNTLITFHNANEELSNQAKVPCLQSNSSDCTINKQGVIDALATNRNAANLRRIWSAWQEIYLPNKAQFNSTLQLVNKAFIPNEQHSARSYWEMLSEYEDGYAKAQTLWEEIQPLYKKLHDFVKVRVYNYYNITQNDSSIPVHLLGSNFGTDWSKIADIVLPHPYFYNEVQTELKYYSVKDIYLVAENTTNTIGLGSLGKRFWTRSDFNFSSCGPHIFSHCSLQYTEILTCDKLGWSEYLDIHETAINVALRNQDYSSLPRRQVRFSALDEALQGVGSLIAIDNLPLHEFIPKDAFKRETDSYNYKNTALLLTALRILPKLPYLLLADTWRLEDLEFSYGNFTETWWDKRNEIQGVQGNTNSEADFLGDSFITSNKPRLSEFLGILLQFQIVDYYQKYFTNENGTIANFIRNDENFKAFIQDRPNKNWRDLVSFHFGIDEVSSTALLEYFKPLEEYLENAPLEQVIISTTPKPRTTKTTTKSTKKPKGPKRVGNLTMGNKEVPVQNDESPKKMVITTKQPSKTANAEVDSENTNKGSSEKMGVFLGIIGVVVACTVLIIVVRRLRKRQKQKTNNRRFET